MMIKIFDYKVLPMNKELYSGMRARVRLALIVCLLLSLVSVHAGIVAAGSSFSENSDESKDGKSVEGRKIERYDFPGEGAGAILIVAGIHGNEPESVIFARALLDALRAPGFEPLAQEIAIVPLLNPDGHALKTRKNANAVDLNRNFPSEDFVVGDPRSNYYGGKSPASEPETLYLLELVDGFKPDLLLILHTPYGIVNSDGDSPGWGPKLARELDLEYWESIGYPTPGSAGTYFGKELGLPVISLELPPRPDVWELFGEKLLRFLRDFSPVERISEME